MTGALEQAARLGRDRQTRELVEQRAQATAPGKIDRVPPLPVSRSAAIQPPRDVALLSARPGQEKGEAAHATPGAIALSSWQAPATGVSLRGGWRASSERELAAPGAYLDDRLHVATELRDPALPTPPRRALPEALRFRYISAPLWWSPSLRSAASAASQPLRGAAEQSLRRGLYASNSAAALWRSILAGEHRDADLSGGMDRRHDAPARELSGVERRLDVLVQLGITGGRAAAGAPQARRGPETVYIAIDDEGRAGPVPQAQLERARSLAQTIDMRIVAAMPPSPPPLEAMSAIRGVPDAAVPRARPVQARSQEPAAEETVSHSRIEGSVEAIAQRIYHRIRQRIAWDRQRFGG
jgi:hypothetical protein